MKTGKITVNPNQTYKSCSDENSYIPVTCLKNEKVAGKLRPQYKGSLYLQELSLMNKTYFGAIQCDIHLDMKFDYTISISFQEMSLSGIETLHHVCELERTKILQSLALAVLEKPFAGYLLSGNSSNVIEYEGNKLWFYTCLQNITVICF